MTSGVVSWNGASSPDHDVADVHPGGSTCNEKPCAASALATGSLVNAVQTSIPLATIATASVRFRTSVIGWLGNAGPVPTAGDVRQEDASPIVPSRSAPQATVASCVVLGVWPPAIA